MLPRRELGSFVSTACRVVPLGVMEEWHMSSEVGGPGLLQGQASPELRVFVRVSEVLASPQDLGSQAGSRGSSLRNLSRVPNT